MSDPSIPPAEGICPWNRLTMDLKGYILWLEYVCDGAIHVEINQRHNQIFKVISRQRSRISSLFLTNPLYQDFWIRLCPSSRRRQFSDPVCMFFDWGLKNFHWADMDLVRLYQRLLDGFGHFPQTQKPPLDSEDAQAVVVTTWNRRPTSFEAHEPCPFSSTTSTA